MSNSVAGRAIAVVLLGSLALCLGCGGSAPARLLLYCGAGIRPPVAEIAQEFSRRHGAIVECDYAGSEFLLGRIKVSGRGDLYMPGDTYYADLAQQQGLISSTATVCYFVPVILVQKGNPKNIKTLADLLRPGIKLGLGDPKACAIGRSSAQIFQKNRIAEDDVKRNVAFQSLTVNELGNQIKLGTLDAAIIWDAVAAGYADDADVIPVPLEQNVVSAVSVSILRSSKHTALAAKFVEFITSPEAKEIFAKHHYLTTLPQ